MNHIKNIFIRRAAIEDQISIDGRVVKEKGVACPDMTQEFNNLRVIFGEFFDSDMERLDSLFVDMKVQKDIDLKPGYLVLARGRKIKFEIS